LVQGVLDEGVGEAVTPWDTGNLAHESRHAGGVEEVEQLVLGALGHMGEQVHIELTSDDRGEREDLVGGLAQAGNPGADHLAHAFVSISTTNTFPVIMGVYSAVLGFFIPSGGGKWIIEAPYVMQAANDLKVHLGWAVQVYNAAEALPNLINPFWMLPLLGVLGLKPRDIIGFTFMQFVFHTPIVLFLLWLFATTLTYTPPVFPH